MRKKKQQGNNFFGWMVSLFFVLGAGVYAPSFASILFLIAGVLLLPVRGLQNLVHRYIPRKRIKGLLAAGLFVVGCLITPGTASDAPLQETTPVVEAIETLSFTEPSGIVTTENIASVEDTVLTIELPEKATEVSIEAPSEPTRPVPPQNSTFTIHFIDVGQADAALVQCDGHYLLVDGGNKADSSKIYSVLKQAAVPKLDIIVATHAHEDHVGGLPGALNYTAADLTLCPVANYNSDAFADFVKYATKNGNGITVPQSGAVYSLGSAEVTVLGLNGGEDTNDTSIILRIDYGETSFLFTGDAEREAEQAVLAEGADLSATVLKVGHHGSDTSTTYPFLREVMPQYAVISVGEGNTYGHPTENTLSRLRDAGVTVFRTDMQGDIYCVSDGKTVTMTVSRNANADVLSGPMETEPHTEAPTEAKQEVAVGEDQNYVANKNTKKFHYPYCSSAKKIKDNNRWDFHGGRQDLISKGYQPCKNCNP